MGMKLSTPQYSTPGPQNGHPSHMQNTSSLSNGLPRSTCPNTNFKSKISFKCHLNGRCVRLQMWFILGRLLCSSDPVGGRGLQAHPAQKWGQHKAHRVRGRNQQVRGGIWRLDLVGKLLDTLFGLWVPHAKGKKKQNCKILNSNHKNKKNSKVENRSKEQEQEIETLLTTVDIANYAHSHLKHQCSDYIN